MSQENEADQAITRTVRILHEWEENRIEGQAALELLDHDIKIIIVYLECIQDKIAKLKKRR